MTSQNNRSSPHIVLICSGKCAALSTGGTCRFGRSQVPNALILDALKPGYPLDLKMCFAVAEGTTTDAYIDGITRSEESIGRHALETLRGPTYRAVRHRTVEISTARVFTMYFEVPTSFG